MSAATKKHMIGLRKNTLNFEMKYFELLDEKEIETIHENALRLLNEVGIIFNYDPAVEILKKAGCRADGQKVFLKKPSWKS